MVIKDVLKEELERLGQMEQVYSKKEGRRKLINNIREEIVFIEKCLEIRTNDIEWQLKDSICNDFCRNNCKLNDQGVCVLEQSLNKIYCPVEHFYKILKLRHLIR